MDRSVTNASSIASNDASDTKSLLDEVLDEFGLNNILGLATNPLNLTEAAISAINFKNGTYTSRVTNFTGDSIAISSLLNLTLAGLKDLKEVVKDQPLSTAMPGSYFLTDLQMGGQPKVADFFMSWYPDSTYIQPSFNESIMTLTFLIYWILIWYTKGSAPGFKFAITDSSRSSMMPFYGALSAADVADSPAHSISTLSSALLLPLDPRRNHPSRPSNS